MAALDFPDTPTVGQLYGSSGTVWRWDGARWASTAGASGARGRVAYAQVTTPQGSITSEVAIAGLSVTWTADPARTYRISGHGEMYSSIAGDTGALLVKNGGTTLARSPSYVGGVNNAVAVDPVVVQSGLSGTQTRSLSAVRSGGTGTFTLYTDPAFPAFILVEDITYEAGTSGTPGAGPKIGAAVVPAFESTASATYLDLATVGPVVTIDTATSALVTLSCGCNISVAGNTGVMGVAVSGATTIAASTNSGLACFDAEVNNTSDYSRQIVVTGLNVGLNIFTAKYATNSSTATFSKGVLSVLAL